MLGGAEVKISRGNQALEHLFSRTHIWPKMVKSMKIANLVGKECRKSSVARLG